MIRDPDLQVHTTFERGKPASAPAFFYKPGGIKSCFFKQTNPLIFATGIQSRTKMLPAYRLKLYRNFKALEANDFHGMIRYYERLEDDIRTLDFEEYFDCTVAYTEALFQTGDHGRHLVMCDHLLEYIIMQNVETWGGEDIYAKILFRKSASHYRQRDYAKAEHVLRELVKLYPRNRLPQRFLRACLLRQKPAWLVNVRALSMLTLLVAAVLIALEMFVVRPFFHEFAPLARKAHQSFLWLGLGVLLFGELRHVWRCERSVARFVRRFQKNRRSTPK